MSTNQSSPNEEAAGILVVNIIKALFLAVGSICRGLFAIRTILAWLFVLFVAMKIGAAAAALALIVMVGVIVIATTDLLSKVTAVEKYADKVKAICIRIAPGVNEVNRFKVSNAYKKALLTGNQLARDMGIVPEDSYLFQYGILAYEEDGDNVIYFPRKKRFRGRPLQALPISAVNFYKLLNSNKEGLNAVYIEADKDYTDKLRQMRFVIKSADSVEPAVIEGNAYLRILDVIHSSDDTLYNVHSYRDEQGQNLEIPEPIGHIKPHVIVDKVIKDRARFGAAYASYSINITPTLDEPWVRIVLITNVPSNLDEANDFLRETSVVSETDATLYKALLTRQDDQVVLTINEGVRGKTPEDIIRAVSDYKTRWGARTVRSKIDGDKIEINFVIKDYLDEGKTIDYIPVLDEQKMSVVCATDAFGNPTTITFENTAGMVIAGIPGSGKTAGATSFLAPIAMSQDVDVSIIDGKGGSDWDAYRPIASNFIQGSENLEEIAVLLEDYVEEMNRRVAEQKEALGTSGFWAASPEVRRAAGYKFRLLIIDECQDLFGTGKDKDERDLFARIERAAVKLIRKGRSSGTSVVFITQKATADAIPTSIRDNCALRIAFRLMNATAKIAILGESISDDVNAPDPCRIPANRKGGAVMANEAGALTEVRFYYIPETILEGIMKDYAAGITA